MCRAGLANGYPWITSLIAFIHVWGCLTALGYENLAHREISGGAASAAIVDSVLKNDIGFPKGLDEIVGIQSLYEWLRMGSEREDAALRFLYHFHDPLAEWEYAGLGHMAYPYSSIVWGLKNGQDWSWRKAREYFHLALTSPGKTEREVNLAKTFKALGHVVHLIQDAGSPAHARNDPHPFNVTYEKIIAQIQASQDPAEAAFFQSLLSNPWRPDSGWQSMAQDAGVPLPLARLFDTDSYGGTNPEVTTAVLMGLAEYTNANFFSEDRTFPENTFFLFRYPHPIRSNTVEEPYNITLSTGEAVKRRYYKKVGGGETGYRLATVGYLADYMQRYPINPARALALPALDESVYRDYAARLIPRAIGYSIETLDYFFRGKLDFEVKIDRENPTLREATVVNMSLERMTGTVAVYAENAAGMRTRVGSFPDVELDPGASRASLRFAPPATFSAQTYVVVFEGTLGAERDIAVAAKVKPWAPPFVFAIQESAEFLEAPQTLSYRTDPEYMTGSGKAEAIIYHNPQRQRVKGTFYFPGEATPGDYITRIDLTFGLIPQGNQVTLRLNGDTEVGHAWSRETGPPLTPKTWEILIDLQAATSQHDISVGWWRILLPRAIKAETGLPQSPGPLLTPFAVILVTPLLLWAGNTSQGETEVSWSEGSYSCPPEPSCMEFVHSRSGRTAQVFIGNCDEYGRCAPWPVDALDPGAAFAPLAGLSDHAVPTATPVRDYLPAWYGEGQHVCTSASVQFQTVSNFASDQGDGALQWNVNATGEFTGSWMAYIKDLTGCNGCFLPPVSHPAPPPLIQQLTFRRTYPPGERMAYEQQNLVPPDYEVVLK
jgi:hypothetical protein